MSKKVRKPKRKFRIFLLVFIMLIVILFSIFLLCAYVFEVKAKTVIIHGNEVVSDSEILSIANMENYPNFFLVKDSDIKKKLKEDPFIEKVDIKRNILFQIHIYITENKPLFIREDTNMIVFDIKKETKNDSRRALDVPYLINYVPNTKYDELIKRIKKIDYNLLKKVSQIKYDPTKYDEDRFYLYMNDSNRVYINLPKFKNFNDYNKMVTKLEGKTGVLYLDSGNYFEIDK